MPPKGDFSDWAAAGGTPERLDQLIETAVIYRGAAYPYDGGANASSEKPIDPKAPFDTAKAFLARFFGDRTLHHHRGAFYHWCGSAYVEMAESALRARLYGFLEPAKPNTTMVNHVLDALRAAAHVDGTIEPPRWLSPHKLDPAPVDLIACSNGLLHLPTLVLCSPSPRLFNLNALEFEYRPDTAEPQEWLAFLNQIWPDDPQSRDTLQEIFGYCLTSDTIQEKAFLIVGPKRSGKGTVGRVLRVWSEGTIPSHRPWRLSAQTLGFSR